MEIAVVRIAVVTSCHACARVACTCAAHAHDHEPACIFSDCMHMCVCLCACAWVRGSIVTQAAQSKENKVPASFRKGVFVFSRKILVALMWSKPYNTTLEVFRDGRL